MARLKMTQLVVVTAALGLAGCDTISSLNPFDTASRYKQELLPEVAPDTLYNQGLARLQSGDTAGAAKAFSDIDRQAAFSPQAKRGLIMTAFAHYEGKRYDEHDGHYFSHVRLLTFWPSVDNRNASRISIGKTCQLPGNSYGNG